MSWITVGQENSTPIELHYEDHGTGPAVVLIHGWPLSGASWEKQVSALLAAGHRVVTYDRRGFGRSSQPTLGYDYDTLAQDLHRLIAHLDLTDVTLVGFSMGGGEVARYFGRYGAERIGKAVFISSITPYLLRMSDNPTGEDASGFEQTQHALLADRPAFLTGFLTRFYNLDLPHAKLVSDEVVRYNWNVAVGASAQGTHDCVGAWLTDFRKDVAGIEVPTLIIHGDADQILPMAATATPLAQLVPGSKLVVVPGGPHGLTWTHAAQVNESLLVFLAHPSHSDVV